MQIAHDDRNDIIPSQLLPQSSDIWWLAIIFVIYEGF